MPPDTSPSVVRITCPNCDERISGVDFRQLISTTACGTISFEDAQMSNGRYDMDAADHNTEDEDDRDYGDIWYECPQCHEELSATVIEIQLNNNQPPQATTSTPQTPEPTIQRIHVGATRRTVAEGLAREVPTFGGAFLYSDYVRATTARVEAIIHCTECNKDQLVTDDNNICLACGAELTPPINPL